MRTVIAGVLYFVIVFAAGFLLGIARTLWVVPRVGTRTAELMEAPLMLVLTFLAARWVVRRFRVPFTNKNRLSMGAIALALMLLAEFSLVLAVRGMTIQQYFATRDPLATAVYYLLLLIFALMPRFVVRCNES
jgi:hypothetical protein